MIKVTYRPTGGFTVEDGLAWRTVEDWITLKDVDVNVSTLILPVMLSFAIFKGFLKKDDVEVYGINKVTGRPILIEFQEDGSPVFEFEEFEKLGLDIPLIDMLKLTQSM